MEKTKIKLTIRFNDGLQCEKTFGLLPPYPVDEPYMDRDVFYWITLKEYLALTNKNSNFRISDTWEVVK